MGVFTLHWKSPRRAAQDGVGHTAVVLNPSCTVAIPLEGTLKLTKPASLGVDPRLWFFSSQGDPQAQAHCRATQSHSLSLSLSLLH